jgi:hypothetical protein
VTDEPDVSLRPLWLAALMMVALVCGGLALVALGQGDVERVLRYGAVGAAAAIGLAAGRRRPRGTGG